MLETLLERFRRGDRLALARLISLAARGENLAEIARALPLGSARVLAITGSGGVGKSTLIGQLIDRFRSRGLRVAVLACDPQSPLSGGALLGDRFRMSNQPDDGVFIRSLATRSGHGAVAEHLDVMIHLCAAFGFDLILLETVGAGQGETAVHELADVVVLLLQPESGDELQWNKAGILEVADIVVIHKADLPGAQQTAAQVKAAFALSPRPVTFLCCSSRTGDGLDALAEKLLASPLRNKQPSLTNSLLLQLAQGALAKCFAEAEAAGEPAFQRLVADFSKGLLDPKKAGLVVVSTLFSKLPKGDDKETANS